MSADTPNKETISTDTTRNDAAPNPAPKALTETEYLQQRADEARRAMSRMVSLIGKNVGHGVDPRVWTRAHPLVALATAAAGGFATVAAIPSPEKRALHQQKRRARQRQRALRKHFERQIHMAGLDGRKDENKPGFIQRIIHEALTIARPLIMELMASVVRGSATPPEPASNGHGGGAGADYASQDQPQMP